MAPHSRQRDETVWRAFHVSAPSGTARYEYTGLAMLSSDVTPDSNELKPSDLSTAMQPVPKTDTAQKSAIWP